MGAFRTMRDRRFKVRVEIPAGIEKVAELEIEVPYLAPAEARCKEAVEDILRGLGVKVSWEETFEGVTKEVDKPTSPRVEKGVRGTSQKKK